MEKYQPIRVNHKEDVGVQVRSKVGEGLRKEFFRLFVRLLDYHNGNTAWPQWNFCMRCSSQGHKETLPLPTSTHIH